VVLLDPIGSIYHHYFHHGLVDADLIRPYYVEGVGEDHLAKCMNFNVLTDVIQFDDQSAFQTCQTLARKEGLFCGGSSGANVWGCLELAKTIPKPAVIVTVLPDSGTKYLSKIYNDDWLAYHGFATQDISEI
jgi:cystathionine beta-synthase/cysteine synthase A